MLGSASYATEHWWKQQDRPEKGSESWCSGALNECVFLILKLVTRGRANKTFERLIKILILMSGHKECCSRKKKKKSIEAWEHFKHFKEGHKQHIVCCQVVMSSALTTIS